MAHGSFPLLFSHLSRLGFPGSEAIRQLWRVAPPFVTAVFSREGMLNREGRILIRGKFRRLLICSVPPLARHLGTHFGLQGGCNSCGASCNLLFRCPHWDTVSRLCTVYESRPLVCRMFPTRRSGRPFPMQTLSRMLRNQVYAGWVCSGENKVKGLHEPIVSQELFDAVQDALDGKAAPPVAHKKLNNDFTLNGLFLCP